MSERGKKKQRIIEKSACELVIVCVVHCLQYNRGCARACRFMLASVACCCMFVTMRIECVITLNQM